MACIKSWFGKYVYTLPAAGPGLYVYALVFWTVYEKLVSSIDVSLTHTRWMGPCTIITHVQRQAEQEINSLAHGKVVLF